MRLTLLAYRVGIGAILAYTCLCSSFTSSIFATSTKAISAEYGISVEVAAISSSLFVLGYAFGPLVSRNVPSLLTGTDSV